ncbi:hypothetical protein J2S21_000791 [Peribacillus cavernae]|nr:hypothetical protein [Peribacillus cavernae]
MFQAIIGVDILKWVYLTEMKTVDLFVFSNRLVFSTLK